MKWKGKIDFEEHPEYDGYLLLSEDAGEFNALTEKTDLVDDDLVIIEDSEDSYAKKKAKRSNIATPTIKQIVRTNITSVITTSATIPYASTPTNTSGTAFGNASITLDDATSVVNVRCVIPCDNNNDGGYPTAIVIRGTTVLGVVTNDVKKAVGGTHLVFDFYDSPGSVGPHTYYIRVGVQSNEGYFNQLGLDATPWGGTYYTNTCWLTLMEMGV
jgi:hypothetical protein